MKRLSLVIVSSILAVALLFGALVVNHAPEAHAAGPNSLSSTRGLPSWVTEANPYVHIVNYHATLDLAVSKVLTTNELVTVEQAVQHYNLLPVSQKQTQIITVTVPQTRLSGNQMHPNWACSGITFNSYWWGNEWWLPAQCAALAAAGFAVIPIVGTIGAAAIAAAIALSCNGSIYIDQPLGAVAYPRPAC